MFTRVSGGLHVFLKLHHPVVATSRSTNNSRMPAAFGELVPLPIDAHSHPQLPT